MGGDGQSLSNKRRLLETTKVFVTVEQLRKEEGRRADTIQTETERNAQRWAHCALSLEPLEVPVVFDLCGRLYSKKVILDYLLKKKHRPVAKAEDSHEGSNITRLSDVCNVANVDDGDKVLIRCPLTGFPATYGVHKFLGFWGCGHVLCASSLAMPVAGQNGMKSHVFSDEQTITSCPFCGLAGFPVPLVLGSEEEEVAQWQKLRPLQRMLLKRRRSEN